ncbi:MAG TPA: DUF5666 domain-containing protein [Candidatus Binatia bacterium]|nr:DUF5666 domain-containing protein [Candidatus Binatia bacterium]
MHEQPSIPEPRAGDAPPASSVAPGPVAVAARPNAHAAWARVGLLGIGVAALIAAAILLFGSTFRPNGTLAAGTDGTTDDATVEDLHGGHPGFPGPRAGRGFVFGGIEITAISGSNISLRTEDDWTRTITVDDGTEYRKAGEEITLGDLKVGDTIAFRQTREDDGTWTIDAITVVLPRLGGEVTAIDGSTITVERRDGSTATVNVADDTKIRVNRDDATLADIEVGMVLIAEGELVGDDTINAERIAAGDLGRAGPRGDSGPWFHPGGPFDGLDLEGNGDDEGGAS